MSVHNKLYIRNSEQAETLEKLMLIGFAGHYMGFFQNTFLDIECNKLEDKQRRRSFDDLLVVARTYFPETTEEELAQVLTKIPKMRALFCRDIEKVVFVRDTDSKFKIDLNSANSYTKGQSKYCANDIYKLAGIEEKTIEHDKQLHMVQRSL